MLQEDNAGGCVILMFCNLIQWNETIFHRHQLMTTCSIYVIHQYHFNELPYIHAIFPYSKSAARNVVIQTRNEITKISYE